MCKETLIENLPYGNEFCFVDEIIEVNEEHCIGSYTFRDTHSFYKHHFVNNPITPGVILTECMAQIGLVCFGMHLLKEQNLEDLKIGMSHTDIQFLKPVFPNEKVIVKSQKVYFRFKKLKCEVVMFDNQNQKIAQGTISGMLIL